MRIEKHRLQEAYWAAWRQRRAAARAAFILRARKAAWLVDASVELDVSPEAVLPWQLDVVVRPRSSTRVRIGANTRIGTGAIFRMRGGRLDLGADCELRPFVTLNIGGDLTVGSGVLLGTGAFLMCDLRLTIERDAIIGPHVLIADSTHTRTPLDEPIHHSRMRCAPTRVGRNTQVGANAIVSLGVDVGDMAYVGPNSVVTGDVPPMWLVVGAPARPVRELVIGQ